MVEPKFSKNLIEYIIFITIKNFTVHDFLKLNLKYFECLYNSSVMNNYENYAKILLIGLANYKY